MRITEECSSAIAVAGRCIATISASSPISAPGPAMTSAPPLVLDPERAALHDEAGIGVVAAWNSFSPRAKSRCSEPIASTRSAVAPNRRSVGTRSSRATSSSIDMQNR